MQNGQYFRNFAMAQQENSRWFDVRGNFRLPLDHGNSTFSDGATGEPSISSIPIEDINQYLKDSPYNCNYCVQVIQEGPVRRMHYEQCLPKKQEKRMRKEQIQLQKRAMESNFSFLFKSPSTPYGDQLSAGKLQSPNIQSPRVPNFTPGRSAREDDIYGGVIFDERIDNPIEVVSPDETYRRLPYVRSMTSPTENTEVAVKHACTELPSPPYQAFHEAEQVPPRGFRAITKKSTGANQADLIVFSPEEVSELHANPRSRALPNETQTRISGTSKKRPVLRGCEFCRSNGDNKAFIMSHNLKDKKTKFITCPVLRDYTCTICGATGNNAHTQSYCPKNPCKYNMVQLKKTPRNSTGLRSRRISR